MQKAILYTALAGVIGVTGFLLVPSGPAEPAPQTDKAASLSSEAPSDQSFNEVGFPAFETPDTKADARGYLLPANC
ncbi:MAG: hypothetical protein AAGB22_04060 [Bacteroidota bacterium]